MEKEKVKTSKVLEEIRDDIRYLPADYSYEYSSESKKVFKKIRDNRKILSDVIPDFKELWHNLYLDLNKKASLSSNLNYLADLLDNVIPKTKREENLMYIKTLSSRIRNFSSNFSKSLEEISDIESADIKHLSPEITCILQELSNLSIALEAAIDSNPSSN